MCIVGVNVIRLFGYNFYVQLFKIKLLLYKNTPRLSHVLQLYLTIFLTKFNPLTFFPVDIVIFVVVVVVVVAAALGGVGVGSGSVVFAFCLLTQNKDWLESHSTFCCL